MRREYALNRLARYIENAADQIGDLLGQRVRPAYATGTETPRVDRREGSIFDYVFFSKGNGDRQRQSGRIRVEGERGKTIFVPVKDIPQDPDKAEGYLRKVYGFSGKVARGILNRL